MIEKLLKKIATHLDKAKIPYMIIGGQAVLLYGTPRLTRDIDITLGIDTDEFAEIEKVYEKIGLKLLVKNPRDFAKQTKVLPLEELRSKMRVDFIFSFTPYEEQAINKARKVILDGYPVRFASCEDIIIHKMFAARAIDEEDIKGILIKHKKGINFRYIRKWLLEFSKIAEQRGILKRFDSLVKQV